MREFDIKISGSGSVASGTYEKIRLNGSARVEEVKCTSFSSSGSTKGESVFCLEDFKSSGSVKFSGNVTAKSIKAHGTFHCAPMVKGDTVKIGKGCIIGTLQYTNSVEVSPKARVDKVEKI